VHEEKMNLFLPRKPSLDQSQKKMKKE